MRRIRLTTGRRALFGALLAAALIVFLPMRLALGWFGVGDAGLSARAAVGSIWSGSLIEARFGDLALGDLRARLSPIQLLVGRARVDLSARDDAPGRTLSGAIGVSRHSIGVDDLTASLPTGRLFAPLPVTALDLDDVSIRFDDGVCTRAEGRVRATIAGDAGGVALPGSLSGAARCESGALLLPLASQAGTEQVTLRISPQGTYRAELMVRPTDPAVAQRLELAGFIATTAGHRLAIEGRF